MFIVIDGIDGCGKSTQVKMLSELYEKRGTKMVTSKWKDSEYVQKLFIGDLLKRFQDGTVKIPPEARTFLLAADISNRLEGSIKPALKQGLTVLGDRYIYKVVAQGIARGLGAQWLDNLFSFAIEPEIKLFLDVDPGLAAERIVAYREISYYEAGMDVLPGADRKHNFIAFQTRVRQNLLAIADKVKGLVVDASTTPDEQRDRIRAYIDSRTGGAPR
ncbi:MAG: dTMP kinase [Candidatus Eisenbacteria bacterium]